ERMRRLLCAWRRAVGPSIQKGAGAREMKMQDAASIQRPRNAIATFSSEQLVPRLGGLGGGTERHPQRVVRVERDADVGRLHWSGDGAAPEPLRRAVEDQRERPPRLRRPRHTNGAVGIDVDGAGTNAREYHAPSWGDGEVRDGVGREVDLLGQAAIAAE